MNADVASDLSVGWLRSVSPSHRSIHYDCRCEGMSTYPRTYDLIHADSVFTLYKNRYSTYRPTTKPASALAQRHVT
jgi:hypothetical protein